MISKVELVRSAEQKHGSRLAIVLNGSLLFTGGEGSGESDIRKWVVEIDWLEAIIALPEQMFYNTGIGTYVWIDTNRKKRSGSSARSSSWMRARSGRPRKRIIETQPRRQAPPPYLRPDRGDYPAVLTFENGERSKIFDNDDFE